jgi:hypothetical protein
MIAPGIAYIIVPGWFLWTAGLVPFAGAVIARHWRIEPLWWISLTCLAQFYAIMMAWDVFVHAWQVVIAANILLAGALLSYAVSRFTRRRLPRHRI